MDAPRTLNGSPTPAALRAFRLLERLPGGTRVFDAGLTWRAPYFRTVRPRFRSLDVGRGEVSMRSRRAVQNHLRTVHAIACCNLVEAAAGVTTEVSVPAGHRWIPSEMSVRYLARATTDLRAVAVVPAMHDLAHDEVRDVVVTVDVTDATGTVVVHADVTMLVSPERRSR